MDFVLRSSISRQATTVALLDYYKMFKAELESIYRDINKDKTVERALQALKQKGLVAQYAVDFRRHIVKLRWDNNTLVVVFYKGLKDKVKDEIARMDAQLAQLELLIEKSVRIDNWLFEREIEKKGKSTGSEFWDKKCTRQKDLDTIDIDTIDIRNCISKEELTR